MNIQIHSLKFDADKKLLDFVHQKVEKLSQFGEDIVHAEVCLRIDKDRQKAIRFAKLSLTYQENHYLHEDSARLLKRRQTVL